MYKLIPTSRVERKLRKISKMSKSELDKIKTILNILSIDPFDLRLKTHKLQGKLSNYYSCNCGYDCRIIFSIDDSNIEYQVIYLIDIGSHDEVY